MGKNKEERVSGLVVLIDKTTYEDPYNHRPVSCVIVVKERGMGDDLFRLPRIRLPEHTVLAGPKSIAEYIETEMSKRIGFRITDPLTFEEEITESSRTLFIFSGTVTFTVAVDSIYTAVTAKSRAELRFLNEHGKISKLHYGITKNLLKE